MATKIQHIYLGEEGLCDSAYFCAVIETDYETSFDTELAAQNPNDFWVTKITPTMDPEESIRLNILGKLEYVPPGAVGDFVVYRSIIANLIGGYTSKISIWVDTFVEFHETHDEFKTLVVVHFKSTDYDGMATIEAADWS